jgi:hypothetical protein
LINKLELVILEFLNSARLIIKITHALSKAINILPSKNFLFREIEYTKRNITQSAFIGAIQWMPVLRDT